MTSLRVRPREIAWLPWGADAFARARTERKPVLLCIVTAWSEACDFMDRTSYADPATAFLINDAFVPVRVDADRRPDVSERYDLGGWPTTAFLTADGDVIGGGTYVEAERLPRVLQEARDAFQRTGCADRARNVRPAAEIAGAPGSHDDLCARVFEAYDDEYGGFGTAAKFPHTAALHLALRRRAGDPRVEQIVTTTLDAMGWAGLYDETGGGFFRCSASRDWRQPLREKTLAVNAQLLRLYLDAAEGLGAARFGERAAGVLRYAQEALADPDGGWYGSQVAGGRGVDRALYADANAAMVSSVLRAADIFGDDALRDLALQSLERVLLACYRPGQGVAHYHDGRPHVRGLLADQIAMATAHLDAYEATGNVVYEMMAEELAHYAIRELWDPIGGGFFDRAGEEADVGLLRDRLKPFVCNCEAARMLRHLAATAGEGEFARLSRATLAAMAPEAACQGPLAAHYLLAVEESRK
jgi:uncharacterized protein YyaL (SSP411 family)